jgi:hypothetical protein
MNHDVRSWNLCGKSSRRVILTRKNVLGGRRFRNYSGEIENRGGGEGGLIDCMNSVAVNSIGAAVLAAGREIAVVSGRIKIAAAIRASLLS